jgi:AcrR family transcriptional regulator
MTAMPAYLVKQKMSQRKWEISCSIAKAFAARGYHAVGMRELAGELGLNPGTLYHHFPSKDGALLAICLIGQCELKRNFEEALGRHAGFEQRIRMLFSAHLMSLRRLGDFIDVCISQWREVPDALAEPVREGGRRLRAYFVEMLNDAASRREIDPATDIRDATRFLSSMFQEVNLLHRTRNAERSAAFAGHAIQVILHGMSA